MKWIALDLGEKRIGIARGDENFKIAFSVGFLESQSKSKDIDNIIDLCIKENADAILIGLPINLDGSYGYRYDETISFVKSLEKKIKYTSKLVKNILVKTYDERFTTVIANNLLSEKGFDGKKKRKEIDATSALVLLQDYFKTIGD